MALNPKQQRFVHEYLIDLNATQAAVRSGYSERTAKQQGSRLLTDADVAAAVAAGKAKQLGTADLSAARVLEEVRRLAMSDVRCLFDEHGNLRSIRDLTDEQAAAVAGLEVVIKNVAAGDGHTDTVHKIKVWDKPKALEMLMKHLGLFEENARVSGTIELVWGSGHGS